MGETPDIVIAGVGLITPLGRDVDSTWRNLLAGRFITDHGRAIEPTGDEPNVIELADIAAREAIASAGWRDELAEERTALVIGTSKGPADEWLVELPRTTGLRYVHAAPEDRIPRFAKAQRNQHGPAALGTGKRYPPTSDKPPCEDVTSIPIRETLPAALAVMPEPPRPRIMGLHEIAEAVAARLDLVGPRLTVSAACASGLHALIRAAILLQSGNADRVLVVASESSLHEAFIQSFRRLGVIANPGEPCRPFDVDRSGFLISEAAAAVCLERRRASVGEVVIDRYAMGADASHLTGTDPAALALKSCLTKAAGGRPLDLVHAHATGTVSNDPIELSAIESAIGNSPATIYSHKGAIGHTLGASGMVATVLNVLAHQTGTMPGNISTRQTLPTTAGQISREKVERPIRHSIAIAAGFGGATGVVSFRKA